MPKQSNGLIIVALTFLVMNADFLIQIASRNGTQYAWLRKSLNNFVLTLLCSYKWNGACYLAKQSVEKLLKFKISDAAQPVRLRR
jgi:hypothetical protein